MKRVAWAICTLSALVWAGYAITAWLGGSLPRFLESLGLVALFLGLAGLPGVALAGLAYGIADFVTGELRRARGLRPDGLPLYHED